MCGRRKVDREYPQLAMKYGNMDFPLVESIAKQLPDGIVVQFHNNGDPFMYPRLGEALRLFEKQIRCFDTNGILLVERANEVIENLDTITISTFEGDDEWEQQFHLLEEFLKIKGARKPNVIIRCLGEIPENRRKLYEGLNCIIADRILHSPMGSFAYTKKPVIPEVGFCLELLGHMAINKDGDVSLCVRFDPKREAVIGNLGQSPLAELWNSAMRKEYISKHVAGKRSELPFCSKCHYWGIPRG
jgi:radical SAM protein with 4Fe4S-binding SPASM domain